MGTYASKCSYSKAEGNAEVVFADSFIQVNVRLSTDDLAFLLSKLYTTTTSQSLIIFTQVSKKKNFLNNFLRNV